MSATSGPSRSLSVGDECPICSHIVTETTAGGLLAYCWWCNDRSLQSNTDQPDEYPLERPEEGEDDG